MTMISLKRIKKRKINGVKKDGFRCLIRRV
jgi:hypothetical protein